MLRLITNDKMADPIFALITEHQAYRRLIDACHVSEGWQESETRAYEALFTATPTTLGGVRALAAHFAKIIRGWGDDSDDLRLRGLVAIEAALGKLSA